MAHPLAVLRKSRRLTQSELAAKTGLSRELISMIERRIRRLTYTTSRLFAQALDVPAEHLFSIMKSEYK